MNREILFRGKRIDNGEWAEGYYIGYKHMGETTHIIATDWAQVYVNSHFVDPDTVGQYIGKPDKNGKMIFEGDIIRQPYSKYQNFDIVGVVRFNKAGQFVVDHAWTAKQNPWKKGKKQGFAITSQCEKLGNIYDNPELLEAVQ